MFGKKVSKEAPSTGHAVTTAGPCQKSLRLHVGMDAIAPVRAAVLSDMQKQATLPGFRKGKAPLDLIEKRYAESLQQEMLQRVTQQALGQATKDYGLKPVGPFEISRADYHETDGLALEATVEVEPEFALAEYTKIPLRRPSADVTPEDMARALTQLQESMAQMVPVPPPTSQTESSSQLVGGAVPPAHQELPSGPAAPATGAPGPATEGEAKERQVPTMDDELAKDLGFETFAALRTHVEAKLHEQKRSAQEQALEGALCEALLGRHTFDVPPRLVTHQTERLNRDFKVRLLMSGKTEAQVNEEIGKFTEQLRTNAERLVKLSFILDRIAEREKLSVTQDEIVQRLWQLSQRWKKDPAEVRKILDDQRLWPSVVSTIREEKTIAFLVSAAQIENGAPPQAEVKSHK